MFYFATKRSLSKLRRKRGKVTYRSIPHGGKQNVGNGNMPLCQSVLWVLSQCEGWAPMFYPVLCPPRGGGEAALWLYPHPSVPIVCASSVNMGPPGAAPGFETNSSVSGTEGYGTVGMLLCVDSWDHVLHHAYW